MITLRRALIVALATVLAFLTLLVGLWLPDGLQVPVLNPFGTGMILALVLCAALALLAFPRRQRGELSEDASWFIGTYGVTALCFTVVIALT